MPASTIHKDIRYIETFFKYASIGIVITDRYGTIATVNPFALKLLGYVKHELIGKKIEILIPQRFRADHSKYHQAYHKKPVTRMMGAGKGLVARKKDGTEIAVEISLSNYELHDEKFVVAFINDLSFRKKAEASIENLNKELENKVELRTKELKRSLALLKAGQTTLQKAILFQKAILDNAGAMIIATNKKGVIRFFNSEASANLGYSQKEVINKITPLTFHCKPEVEKKRKAYLEAYGVLIPGDVELMVAWSEKNTHQAEQYTYVRKNGTTFPVSLTITTVYDKNRKIIGYMGVAFDITRQLQRDNALQELLEKEKDLSEMKSRFISMASHEFRTPLSTILSSAYLIEKYTKSADQQQREKHIKRITSATSMLTDILNDFLSLGKIEEGKIPVRLKAFKITDAFADMIDELKGTLQSHQEIVYTHSGEDEIEMDQSILKHIVFNLVSNASKFSPEDSCIEIRTTGNKDAFILAVIDTGIGISEEDQKHLAERFFRGTNAGNIQGTGLGLHIVSKYAELMNGTVACTSELGKGSAFIITFRNKNNGHEKDTVDRRQ